MSDEKVRISAVRYANTYPFIYGLTETGFDKKVILETDHPSDCAAKLADFRVDIGLIPVAALPGMKEYHIITDYCLGAYGKVRTVMLLSNSHFEKIETVSLDYRSRSSVNLAKILAKNYWKRKFSWKNTSEGFDFINIADNEAVILIGDQCFELEKMFAHQIDLSEEWYKYTGLPFTFACWTSNKTLDDKFLDEFNTVLGVGVNNLEAVVEKFGKSGIIRGKDLEIYLTMNMNYHLNAEKRKAINLFIDLMQEL